MSSKVFKIVFKSEVVEMTLNISEFSFVDMDRWIRSRFGISETEKLKYKDSNQKELLISKTYVNEFDIVHVETDAAVKKEKVVVTIKTTLSLVSYFYMAVPILVALSITQQHSLFAEHIPVFEACNLTDQYLIELGVIPKSGASLEACIAFICWATTYLFIRRLWNPETFHGSLERFSADSFYGGLAAAASVFLKTFLVARAIRQ